VAEAVAELVDNAIDARSGKSVKVEVSYDHREGWIEVADNGKGMDRDALAAALVLGLSAKRGSDIGRFGLGLKTACTSLGRRFQIVTCPAGSRKQWRAQYDEEAFLNKQRWSIPIEEEAKSQRYGTTIRIESSRVYYGLEQSLLRNLGSTFRHFIDDGVLALRLNGAQVPSVHQDVDTTSVLPLDGSVIGHPVRGWVGLLTSSSQRGWYGFSLIRHRRVIRRHEKLGFRAHPSTARVVGELHLDDFPVNNLKTDFIRETDAWHALEQWVSEKIEPILQISRALAHAGTFDSNMRKTLSQERDRVLAALGPDESIPLPAAVQAEGRVSEAVNVVLGSSHLAHRFELVELPAPHMRVEYVSRADESDQIVVFTNVRHAAMSANDPSVIACHNLAEAAALALGSLAEFIFIKGQLLEVLLEQKSVRRALRGSAEGFPVTKPHQLALAQS
jgi:hypothetical protein